MFTIALIFFPGNWERSHFSPPLSRLEIIITIGVFNPVTVNFFWIDFKNTKSRNLTSLN